MRLIASDMLNRFIDHKKKKKSDPPSAWVRGDCEGLQELSQITAITLDVCTSSMQHSWVSEDSVQKCQKTIF